MSQESSDFESRQERREKRLQKKREKMAQHGRAMAELYRWVILKRARKK